MGGKKKGKSQNGLYCYQKETTYIQTPSISRREAIGWTGLEFRKVGNSPENCETQRKI